MTSTAGFTTHDTISHHNKVDQAPQDPEVPLREWLGRHSYHIWHGRPRRMFDLHVAVFQDAQADAFTWIDVKDVSEVSG